MKMLHAFLIFLNFWFIYSVIALLISGYDKEKTFRKGY